MSIRVNNNLFDWTGIMKAKTNNRRNFIKSIAACSCYGLLQAFPSISSGKQFEYVGNQSDLKYFHEDGFIIINGWVLLKSDIEID